MSGPTSTTALHAGASMTGGLVVWLGPEVGPWVSVFVAAFVGAMWTVGAVETVTRLHAGLIMLRIILTACILTGALAYFLANYTSIPLDHVLPLTAFGLGALGDKFGTLKDAVVMRLRALIGGPPQ